MNLTSSSSWVRRDFSGADLGDARRSRRLVSMIERIAAFRGGTVAATFPSAAERQAAYDFLEHDALAAADLHRAASAASARNARLLPEVLVIVDGTSLSLVDKMRQKDFGSVGAKTMATRGLKYMTSLFVAPTGVPIGIGPLTWWRRDHQVVDVRRYRPAGERESKYWHDAIDAASASMAVYAPRTTCHFVCDREADASHLLKKLVNSEHEFTIRGNQRRNVEVDGRSVSLLKHVRRAAPIIRVLVDVPGSSTQRARRAVLEVRRARVDLLARDRYIGSLSRVKLTRSTSTGTCPSGVCGFSSDHRSRTTWRSVKGCPASASNSRIVGRQDHGSMTRRIRQHHGATFRQGHGATPQGGALEFARVMGPALARVMGPG